MTSRDVIPHYFLPYLLYRPNTGGPQHAVSGLQRCVEQVPAGVRPHGADVCAANDGETRNRPDGTPKEAAAGASGQATQMVEGNKGPAGKVFRDTQVVMGIEEPILLDTSVALV